LNGGLRLAVLMLMVQLKNSADHNSRAFILFKYFRAYSKFTMSMSEKTGKMLVSKNWDLEILGRGQLNRDGQVVPLERKTAALFAYLALEGPTSRSKLAGMLWADSTEDTARSNLRQRLYRLRVAVGKDLIVSDEPLRLEPSLEIDAVRFESLIFTGEFETALQLGGELLAGHDYDDCPDLNDWVLAARERLEAGWREALGNESASLEIAGDYSPALKRAEQLLARNPISEDANRRVMRLHYLAGDRPAALRAFEQCKTILETQLGVEPLPETQNLARLISVGDGLPQIAPATRVNIPIQVLRPPILAGRDHEWAQLEAAWQNKLVVIVRGEPGVGKTRLMLDFVNSKGPFMLLECRPGDAAVPYATLSRGLKLGLELYPDLKLESWVRRELSRIIPELEAEAPAAITSDTEKLRFFQAIVALPTYFASQGAKALVVDDLQFMDAASFELWQYVSSQLITQTNTLGLRGFCAYRQNELEPEVENNLVQNDQTTLVDVKPLGTQGLNELLRGLELPGVTELTASLEQYTGGNPMYVLETLKSLLETDGITRGLPQHFPPPHKIGALIRHRLERLSPSALRLARVAAIAETDFNLELAASILEIKPFDLAELLIELERAQVLVGVRFAHDLIFEATREGIPVPIKNLVHRSTATYLEGLKSEPARIAHHWLAASESMRAVPFLKDAALQAVLQYQLREAVNYATQAAQILEQAQNPELAWAFWEQVKDVLQELEQGEKLEVVIRALHRTASTPVQRAQSLNAECSLWLEQDNLAKAKPIAEQAIQASIESKDLYAIGTAQSNLGTLYWMQGETSKAADHLAIFNDYAELNLRQCLELARPEAEIIKAKRELATALSNYAVMLDGFGRYEESELKYKRAIEIFREIHDISTLAHALINFSLTLLSQGRGREALENVIDAKQQQALLNETTLGSINTNSALSNAHTKLDQYTQALQYAQQTRVAAEAAENVNLFDSLARLGKLYRILGVPTQARKHFQAAQAIPQTHVSFEVPFLREYAMFLIEQGENASEIIEQALNGLDQTEHLYGWYKTHLELLAHVKADEQMQIVDQTLMNPGLRTMKGLHILALTRGAQLQLELGKVKKALEFSQQAIALLEDYDPDLQRAEVLLTHYRALEGNNHKTTKPFLEQTLSWLLEVANHQVPPEYHDSFLTRNPFNAAIIKAARHAGLELSGRVTLQ
jgi:DNA-binding SARP family transcriptional activator